MRVCTKCMKSHANTAVHAVGTLRPPNSFLTKMYITGSISTPNSVPMKRQPKGDMPNMLTPSAIMSLPSGGWDISYGYTPFRFSHAVRA